MLKQSWLWAACALVAAPLAAAAPAEAQVVNHTGYPLHEVPRAAPPPSPAAPEQLGQIEFVQGQAHTTPWSAAPHCQQDIAVVFTDEEQEVRWEHLNVCTVRKMTVRYNKHTGAVSTELE